MKQMQELETLICDRAPTDNEGWTDVNVEIVSYVDLPHLIHYLIFTPSCPFHTSISYTSMFHKINSSRGLNNIFLQLRISRKAGTF